MKRTNDVFMFLLIGLASVIAILVFLQRPVDPALILGACGFTLFTFGWTGMYFRLKRELPEHALVNATYLNFGNALNGYRRAGLRNMLGLIRVHFERHRVDVWSALLIAGLGMLAASFVNQVALTE